MAKNTAKDTSKSNGRDSNKQDYKTSYERRRKKWVAAVAVVLVVIFVLWTVGSSLIVVWGNEKSDGASGMSGAVRTSADERMRGVWVSTVSNIDFPAEKGMSSDELKAQIDQIVYDTSQAGMNAVFFQVRPTADAFYRSAYFPWSSYITGTQGTAPDGGFDPLQYFIEAAHSKGMELHAWINPYRIAANDAAWEGVSGDNPAKSTHADCVVKYVNSYYFDPGRPESRELIIAGAAEIVQNYDVDGIHMDDYFYPASDFDDDLTYEKYGRGFSSKFDWRVNNVDTLIEGLRDTVKSIDPGCDFGISPMGIWANSSSMSEGSATSGSESYFGRCADSRGWVKKGLIDYIAPQIYWNIGFSIADYRILANWWSDVVKGTGVKLYIGMADYRANSADSSSAWYGTGELDRQLALNGTLPEVDGEIHFTYSSIAESAEITDFYKEAYGGSLKTEPIAADAPAADPSGEVKTQTPEEPALSDAAKYAGFVNPLYIHTAVSFIGNFSRYAGSLALLLEKIQAFSQVYQRAALY